MAEFFEELDKQIYVTFIYESRLRFFGKSWGLSHIPPPGAPPRTPQGA